MSSSIRQIGEDIVTHWFHERYISRAEHQEIVAHYKRLVVYLYANVRTLRARGDETPPKSTGTARPMPDGANVIHVEFRRQV